jgi:hypothetical protein
MPEIGICRMERKLGVCPRLLTPNTLRSDLAVAHLRDEVVTLWGPSVQAADMDIS